MITFHIGWPQGIWLLLVFIRLSYQALCHGKPYETKVNFWNELLVAVTLFLLLWWGGFFR